MLLKMHNFLLASKFQFNATTLSTDNDDIAKGLLELIKQHKVTDLVMGAGSAKNFSILTNSKAKYAQNLFFSSFSLFFSYLHPAQNLS